MNPTEAYALVTATFRDARYVLLIETDAGWAMPGGTVRSSEIPVWAALRALAEGTGMEFSIESISTDEPRDGFVVARCDLGEVEPLPEVRAGDDAQRAGWWGMSETRWSAEYTDVIFPAHREILGALR